MIMIRSLGSGVRWRQAPMSRRSTSGVNWIQTLLNSVKTDFDLIDAPSLTCDLRLQMADLGHDMSHRRLERGDARFYLHSLSFQLVDDAFQLVDDAPDVPQMLKHDVVWFVSHKCSLANPKSCHHPALCRSAGGYEPAFPIVKP